MLLSDAKKMVEKNILNVGDVHICCRNCSYKQSEEYIIENIYDTETNVTFDILSLSTGKKYHIDYKDIIGISDMTIEDIKDAYELDIPKPIIVYENTDVSKDIVGYQTKQINTNDGLIELKNGMKVLFMNDSSLKYNQKMLKVLGVGESIKLSLSRGRPKKIR